jgi:hypothetical protein
LPEEKWRGFIFRGAVGAMTHYYKNKYLIYDLHSQRFKIRHDAYMLNNIKK